MKFWNSNQTPIPILIVSFQFTVHKLMGHGSHESNPNQDFLSAHMDSEHHIQGFDMASAFHLHDLNRDNILEAEEILKLYGVDHETALDQSTSVKHHDSKAERILSEVMEKLDINKDGIITKSEFVAITSKDGLPSFSDIPGLGHHYDEEGEYFLHHEESHHGTPETQTEESYAHPEDIKHFSHHQEIEAKEEELDRIAQGLPESEQTIFFKKQQAKHAQEEEERAKRVEAARQQALKYGDLRGEAERRGDWGKDGLGLRRPKDKADRLRKNVPYKYKIRKSFWGEF
ncbi:uncharacterized protein MELLADRAFT_115270 [Melampsora larici-populina 98AG31]|uniref:EF-hand domain-containing protein n=1 Tax=Melampsora larici-populina (strain 98AG31 / pathotype 3-4-7) TaxID=747676 RepID=F4R8E8_MELLP|nr:uncharacterized protein MELLADRAFT_115270 [Melampsora larici-populina 98AG31]EGG11472.1 hypothetical protein MELLADRAFT_115270 [Melampsora larici-populina 98AG31]